MSTSHPTRRSTVCMDIGVRPRVRTAHKNVELIHQRLKLTQQDYEVR